MGSEDLFHRRKAKVADKLERRKAKRDAYDKVLIVCEGGKTEPNYFNELVDYYKINSANVAIDGSCGSSPMSVYERAHVLYQAEVTKGDSFDRVYCVFDKDSHDSYEEALRNIASEKPEATFYATISIPCFEYWLLLHFKYTTKPYARTGSSSVGNEVLKDLVAVMPDYEKGSQNLFSSLFESLEFAKSNAARSLKEASNNHTDNPSTNVQELVVYLQNIKPEDITG